VALALGYQRAGDLPRAREYTMQALAADPRNPVALKNLGAILGKEGDSLRALYYLRRSFEIDPQDPQTVYGLAWPGTGLGRLQPGSSRLEAQSIEIYGKAANILGRVVRAPRTAPEKSRTKVCLKGNSIRVAHYSDPEGAEGTTERCIYVCLVSCPCWNHDGEKPTTRENTEPPKAIIAKSEECSPQ
jgi:tetratricopeptide (TPR) repeat protein